MKRNVKTRITEVEVKGQKIVFDEYYKVDEDENEIFDRELELENDIRLYEIYKKQNGLLTIEEIKSIRRKYGLNQKEYAQAIGVGEITVHRFENGSIQTEAVDAIMRLSQNPRNMEFLILQNRKNLSDELYEKIFTKVSELLKLQAHAVMKFDKAEFDGLKCITKDVKSVAQNIIKIYNDQIDEKINKFGVQLEYITNLKLQKLLYYVQAYSLLIFGKKAYNEKIIAWSYGPVVEEIYQEYKNKHSNGIKVKPEEIAEISNGLEKIIEKVVDAYGGIEATELIDFTHEEEPWDKTMINDEISTELIKEYFEKVYSVN